jgi:hypothetical protein
MVMRHGTRRALLTIAAIALLFGEVMADAADLVSTAIAVTCVS